MGNTSIIFGDEEFQLHRNSNAKQGGWITFPFIILTIAGLTLAGGGWLSNLIVYLIDEFHMNRIDAAQINNIVSGCTSLFPVVGAIIADSFLGSFTVIWICSFISLLGLLLFLLLATVDGLRPEYCPDGRCGITPSSTQYAMLYLGLTLVAIGLGGSRFTMATMGANQFTKAKHQDTYFNWYFFTLYLSTVIASTAIVYVEDNVSWAWGFGICIMANAVGLIIFLLGKGYYYFDKPQGSPFTSLAQVIVASLRKGKAILASQTPHRYYYGKHDGQPKRNMKKDALPTNSFRFLNRAAVKIEGDVLPDGSIAKPWNLCTVQQVEDLKTLIRIFPLWSSSILLGTPIGIQSSLSVLQALTMDRNLGSHFKFPAGSILVFTLVTTSICLGLFDRFLWPVLNKFLGRNPTPLQRIGIGHMFNVASMAVSALVETKRRNAAHSMVAISVMWLVPQLVIVGIGEALHFPAQVALYYQEFPTSLKSMATAMISMLIGIAFYLSTAAIDLFRKLTTWLPSDINDGKLDNVYWVVAVLGVVNFGYYLVCANVYKYKNVDIIVETDEYHRPTETASE